MFEVVLSPEARVFFSEADAPLARELGCCFAQLETDPRRHNNIKQLSGELAGRMRYRVGDWRVLYTLDDKLRRVNVLLIAHRSEVYE
jgi:mRNA interferase RelE/StbE